MDNSNSRIEKKDKNSQHEERLIGSSAEMQQVYKQIEMAGSCDVPVLLIGETGTGKEVAARTIHRISARKQEKFVPVNLGAIPEGLVSSMLFGHEKGAFTGADRAQSGVFEQGNDGTVFLDEISSIDHKAQIGLLRLLEEKNIARLGGAREIANNARIIAATNENLKEKCQYGSFREDLYFRLDVFSIKMPLLKNRSDDIPELVDHFLFNFNQAMQKNVKKVSDDVLQKLRGYDWPGNIRELKNVIQRALIVCDGSEIQLKHLPPRFKKISRSPGKVTIRIGTTLENAEREMIVSALEVAKNNRTHAASLLGISRRAIYNKLKKHDIQ